MEKNDNIIDLGSWTVPSSWKDISLKMYQELERFYDDMDKNFDIREVIHILCGKSKDEVNMLPLDFLEKIMGSLSFIQESIKEEEPRNWVEIDGEKYTVHTENQLRTGEYIAADTALKGDKHNYASLLAILCRKEGELYDSKFENEVLEDRIKMWEEQPVVKILPLVNFFLSLYIASMTPTLLSSKVRDAIVQERENIQNLQKSGELSKRYTKSLMKKLRKLEKSISTI